MNSVKKKTFAILVINYNGKKYLSKCLESLSQLNNCTEGFDLFLIDNASSDGSVEFVRKNFTKVEIIDTGDNLGYSGAYNFAHSQLKDSHREYDYYFIVNNDTYLASKDLLTKTDELFASDEKIGTVSPTIVDASGIIQLQGGDFWFLSGTTFGHLSGKKYKKESQLILSKWASGCAMFIRQSLFDRVGGFDDYFMYQEDVGLSWKILNLGYKIVADASTSIVHIGGGTDKPTTFEHYYSERNRLVMYWQNLSTPVFVVVLPFFLVLRMILLSAQGSSKIAREKALAIFHGFQLTRKFKKRNTSISTDLKIIMFFHSKIKSYENSLSNS